MIIKGARKAIKKNFSAYLLCHSSNEHAAIRSISGYPARSYKASDLKAVFSFMAAHGHSRCNPRPLYHAIIALQAEEELNEQQLEFATSTLAGNLELTDHQRVVVEHRKGNRQHFHIVFNILHPLTGKAARLSWASRKLWDTSRHLEEALSLKPVDVKGHGIRAWEYRRAERSGVDPHIMRKSVTGIYHSSKNEFEFISNLQKANFTLATGKHGYVLIDKSGDSHGLLKRIEGVSFSALRAKFPELKNNLVPSLSGLRKKKLWEDLLRQLRCAAKAIFKRQRHLAVPKITGTTPFTFSKISTPVVEKSVDKKLTAEKPMEIWSRDDIELLMSESLLPDTVEFEPAEISR